VGSTNFTEIGDPAVGLHVAGLYSPRPQGALALMFDLEQVEVLRGPQGTLFGRNSTGGSINIIPAKPDFSGSYGTTELDLGSYNKRQINIVQNLAVNDRFALRATFSKVKRDGWINQLQD
ncbi:TonB-dependent receptor plug domain-containing protein, partial [Enterobacter cloacae complex sp.6730661]